MYAATRFCVFNTSDNIHSWISVTVAGAAQGTKILDMKVSIRKALAQKLDAICIIFSRWINRGNFHQVAGKLNKFVSLVFDSLEEFVVNAHQFSGLSQR